MDGHFDHRLTRTLARLADRLGDLVGLAEAAADLAIVVTGDDQCTEREAASTLHDLGATVDEHDLFGRLTTRRRTAVIGVTGTVVAAIAAAGLLARHRKMRKSVKSEG